MCLAVPMKLVDVRGAEGVAISGGVRCAVRLDLVEDAAVGLYVLVHAGYAIQLLDDNEAHETLELLRQMSAAGAGELTDDG
jgi:hydrogenase expression/formation protein HypC